MNDGIVRGTEPSDAWQRDRAKHLEINTFADFRAERDRVADWLESARLALLWPLVAPDRPIAVHLGDDERGSHFSEGTLVTVVGRRRRAATPTVQFGVDAWPDRLAEFRAGKMQTLRIEIGETAATPRSRGFLGFVSVDAFGSTIPPSRTSSK